MKSFLLASVLLSGLVFADAFDACDTTDAKCVGRVLLSAIQLQSPNSARTHYCKCVQDGTIYRLELHRIADGSKVDDLESYYTANSCNDGRQTNVACQ